MRKKVIKTSDIKTGHRFVIGKEPRFWSNACGGKYPLDLDFPYTSEIEEIGKPYTESDYKRIPMKDKNGFGWDLVFMIETGEMYIEQDSIRKGQVVKVRVSEKFEEKKRKFIKELENGMFLVYNEIRIGEKKYKLKEVYPIMTT